LIIVVVVFTHTAEHVLVEEALASFLSHLLFLLLMITVRSQLKLSRHSRQQHFIALAAPRFLSAHCYQPPFAPIH
jgi:hypothetical protein